MKAYSIFDDFGSEPIELLINAGVELTVHPFGKPRPNKNEMKVILENYDCVIIGTSQKITEDMFENVSKPRIIATASVGLDHIRVPNEKRALVEIINTPKASAQSVAEYTIGCALSCCKRLSEAGALYADGKNNKALSKKPEDLWGKTIGVIGAGNISARIMQYATFLGMKVLCWTPHPEKHKEIVDLGVTFRALDELAKASDVISVNLPNTKETEGLISAELISLMKKDMIFISVSRRETLDIEALISKAYENQNYYVCLDLDVADDIVSQLSGRNNVLVTPHIAGGTVETRKRMFLELARHIADRP